MPRPVMTSPHRKKVSCVRLVMAARPSVLASIWMPEMFAPRLANTAATRDSTPGISSASMKKV
jgi:hypothetical protein